jgi:hypothetical protein
VQRRTGPDARATLGPALGEARALLGTHLGTSWVLHWSLLASTVGDRLGTSWESWSLRRRRRSHTGRACRRELGNTRRARPELGEELGGARDQHWARHSASQRGARPQLGAARGRSWARAGERHSEELGPPAQLEQHWSGTGTGSGTGSSTQVRKKLGPALGDTTRSSARAELGAPLGPH